MARADTLRLLLASEIPSNLEGIEALLTAIAERLDLLEPGSETHQIAHAKLDALLTARDRLTQQR